MKTRQVNFIAMCKRVSELMKKYPDLFHKISVFSSLQDSFDSNLAEMQRLGELQATIITGFRKKKADMKLNLARNTMILSCRAEAYADRTTDVVLQHKIHRAETHLLKLSDGNFTTSCEIVFHAVLEKREALAPYGIDDASLSEMKMAMDDYRAVMDTPKEAIIARKLVTWELAELIKAQRAVLDKIDNLSYITFSEHPAIHAEYWDTRKVLYRSRTRAVQCSVTDTDTGKGLKAAVITFTLNDATVLQKRTHKAGGANIQSLKEGTYTVTVAKPCYISQTLTVNNNTNELTKIEVKLTRLNNP